MQMALKWLFFAKKLEKLPSGWGFDPNLYGLVLQGDTTEAFFEQNFVLTFWSSPPHLLSKILVARLYVKTFFVERTDVFVFLEHTQDCLGRSYCSR